MATRVPLGSFFRGRRDWGIEQLAIGNYSQQSNSPQQTRFALNNNSITGNYLACYGILARCDAPPHLMGADVLAGFDTTAYGNSHMVVPGTPMIDGLVSITNVANEPSVVAPYPLVFRATGDRWLTLGDVPLFVIPPGMKLGVWGFTYDETITAQAFSCSFLWGYYHAAVTPSGLLSNLVGSLTGGGKK